MKYIVLILILLHSPDGREVNVNVEEITSLHCKMPGVENKLFAEGVNTVINLTDGKYVTVRETCTEVRDFIQEAQR